MTLVPGTRLGHYEIRSHIGAGGMGEVYLAQDTELERLVALKVLPAGATWDEQGMRRFVQEAKAVSVLNHPNILTIHEIGKAGDVQFMATELVKGITLRQRLDSGRIDLNQVLDVSIQAASALASAHDAGIIHRDIKPENIMLREDGYLKVLDFGLAKFLDSPETDREAQTRELITTNPELVVGTLRYMSPEQARGKKLDHTTDIWSLGVVIYEMVASQQPFNGDTATDLLASILMVPPPPLTAYWPQTPEELERIVIKALTKDRENRYQSARDLLIDLRLLKLRLEVESEVERIAGPGGHVAIEKSTGRLRPIPKGGLKKPTPRRRQLHKVIDSLAILPLMNMGRDPEIEYLSDGITESIINTLSQIPDLRVMARSTVFRYKGREVNPREVGSALNVRAILTGKVLQLGENLIIKAELVDVENGSQLWGGQFDRQPGDILAIQREISSEIAANLRVKLSGEQKKLIEKRHTENIRAYHLYLKGRYCWNKRTEQGLKQGIEFFNQAIEEDHLYALAYVGLADSHNMLATYNLSQPGDVFGRAKAAAESALEIDNELAEAHTSLAKVKADYDWDWPAAEQEFKRSLELNQNYATGHHWYALHLMSMGQFEEATAEIKLAQHLDPLSLSISASAGLPAYWSRHYDEAIEQFRRTLELDLSFPLAHVLLGQAYAQKGMFDEAITELIRARELDATPRVRALLGYTLAVAGRRDEALRILNELEEEASHRYVSPFFRVLIYSALGEQNQALEWLEKAYEERSEWLVWIKVDPKLDSLRATPGFTNLMRRVGLP